MLREQLEAWKAMCFLGVHSLGVRSSEEMPSGSHARGGRVEMVLQGVSSSRSQALPAPLRVFFRGGAYISLFKISILK